MTGTPDYLLRNRRAWDSWAQNNAEAGRQGWATDEITWGIWNVAEADLRVLPDVVGKDIIEVGCGTAYFSAWLARRGAQVVGIDNSPVQLASARVFQHEFRLDFPLIHASAEAIPVRASSFDVAISEYGASIWADPYLWIPEAARVLRPGGQLVFLVNGTILMLCAPDDVKVPATNTLIRNYFGMHRLEWPGEDEAVEFHLGYGDWIRLLRRYGFEVEDLIEVRPPKGSRTRYEFVTPEWAGRWPSEEIWKARKRTPTIDAR